jgi:D-alanyl-lipoteichoic acid acyltransferase DltB (MBOAT superfamily)
MLCLFKYADFGIGAVHDALALAGVEGSRPYLGLVLPVGISFYTFQTLSYTIDVYRGHIAPTRSLLDFATFVSFFPQLVAGPIVRAGELLPQLAKPPSLRVAQAGDGLYRILKGMAKKVLVADFLAANVVDRVFDNPGGYSSSEVLVATLAYTCQIYFDFSGYTDIAIGSGKLFGFELPENFRRPYQATGPIEFWRRWHITLSSWIRDYVYIPLGGSRVGRARTYVNLFVAFVITGVWHGAGWTFVAWGLLHGVAVTLNRAWRDVTGRAPPESGASKWSLVAVHTAYVSLHWPLFRAASLADARAFYGRLLDFDFSSLHVPPAMLLVVAADYALHYLPDDWSSRLRDRLAALPAPAQAAVVAAVSAIVMYVGSEQASPFIYFQF